MWSQSIEDCFFVACSYETVYTLYAPYKIITVRGL